MRLETVLFGHCRRAPEKDALVFGDRRVSFGELETDIRSLAAGLQAHGITPGDKIVLYLPNGVEFLQVLFAAISIGAIAVPVSTRLTVKELAYVCDDSGATVVVCDIEQATAVAELVAARERLSGFVSGGECQGMTAFDALFGPADTPLPNISVERDECMIMYTSGTTGKPKGVVQTHANMLVSHGFMNGVEWGIGANDRYLVVASMAHRAGLGRAMNATLLGGTLTIAKAFDTEHVIDVIEREAITVFGMVPTMCRMLLPSLKAAPERCRSLRRLVVTGEAFPVSLKKQLIALLPETQLISFFAITEAGFVTNLSHEEQFSHPGSVGRAVPGVEVRFFGAEDGREVARGDVGEVAVRSGRPGAFTVMKEYYNRPDATAEVLRDGWFYTGDMGYEDAEGYLYIVDRKKDMILSGGFNIYSKEVEMAIGTLPGLSDVAVVGVPDPLFGEAVAAFIETADTDQSPTSEQVIAHCREAIAGHKKPKYVFFRKALPRNAVGKVLKYQLAAEATAELVAAGTLSEADLPDLPAGKEQAS